MLITVAIVPVQDLPGVLAKWESVPEYAVKCEYHQRDVAVKVYEAYVNAVAGRFYPRPAFKLKTDLLEFVKPVVRFP